MAKVNNSISDKRPYKVYTALIMQSGTDAPIVVEELENTLGEITFEYGELGWYYINSDGLFKINKTIVNLYGFEKIQGSFGVPSNLVSVKHAFAYKDDASQANQLVIESGYLYMHETSGIGMYHSDDVISEPTGIRIEVYN